MKRIYKYACPIDDVVTVDMPAAAQILSVQAQNKKTYVWALVDTLQPLVARRFQWIGTGNPADQIASSTFVGTVQELSGALVFHLFVD